MMAALLASSVDDHQADSVNVNLPLIEPRSHNYAELIVFLRDRAGIYFNVGGGNSLRVGDILDLFFEEQSLPPETKEVFSLWLVSSVFDLRLKENHKPFQIIQQWDQLCALYTDATNDEIHDSEPVLMIQRDVFYPKRKELLLTNVKTLSMLYHEAKYNVLQGRYVLLPEHYHRLAGLQALAESDQFSGESNLMTDLLSSLTQFYPEHQHSRKHSVTFGHEKRNVGDFVRQFIEAHQQAKEECSDFTIESSVFTVYRKYLEVCWSYPFYGSVFFSGTIQAPSGQLKKIVLPCRGTAVRVAISTDGVTIIDRNHHQVLIFVPFSQLSWDFSDERCGGDAGLQPCLFLQFLSSSDTKEASAMVEGGTASAESALSSSCQTLTKLLRVYSPEAKLMDALIDTCVKRVVCEGRVSPRVTPDEAGVSDNSSKTIIYRPDCLCLATFTLDGEDVVDRP